MRKLALEIGFLPLRTLLFLLLGAGVAAGSPGTRGDFRDWSLEEAVAMLTDSPWARRETYTRLIGGIGSGLAGEKEIYSTFFVRFLSARPIREAYARITQLQAGYERLDGEAKRQFDAALEPGLNLDVADWIVVTVTFRSNDQNLELRVRQFLANQTTETSRNRAHLSTERFPQLELAAYFPPAEEIVGGRFVFPRFLRGKPVVLPEDTRVTFELDVPGFDPELRATFTVSDMMLEGKPAL